MAKKVKIITFHFAVNYGAFLQTYALVKQLKDLGYIVEVIDYKPLFVKKNYLHFGKSLISYLKRLLQYFLFVRYINKNLPITSKTYKSCLDFTKYRIDTDLLICGSDQIWNTRTVNGVDCGYFATFPLNYRKKIAYAVSMGDAVVPDSLQNQFKSALNGFENISVRENSTRDKILACGVKKEIDVVLDPTLLPIKFDDIVVHSKFNNKCIVVYFVIRDKELEESVKKLSDLLSLPIINISSHRLNCARRNLYFLNPGAWLGMIKDATFVCTNSYHASIFSILFEKKFYSIELHGEHAGLNARISELLFSLGLRDRLLGSHLDIPLKKELLSREIDYKNVQSLLKKRQEFSLAFLNKSLNCYYE